MAIGDYVLTEDVNVNQGIFFAKNDCTGMALHCLEVASILRKAKEISRTFLF